MFWNDPTVSIDYLPTDKRDNHDQPWMVKAMERMNNPLTEEEISSLQETATALLDRIHTIKRPNEPQLDPNATPFIPTQTEPLQRATTMTTTTAQIHSPPTVKWENVYSHTYMDNDHLKHALRRDIRQPSNQDDWDNITLVPDETGADPNICTAPSSPTHAHLTQTTEQCKTKRRVHWKA